MVVSGNTATETMNDKVTVTLAEAKKVIAGDDATKASATRKAKGGDNAPA
jgi:hypothetical protein